jgi:dTDP-4-dehydrorhamnose 3,5-epimerase
VYWFKREKCHKLEVTDLTKNIDERGFFAELARLTKSPVQINLSYSYPGIVRAWHRHPKGQTDRFICLQGSIKVAELQSTATPNDVIFTGVEIKTVVLSEQKLQMATVDGRKWHGFEVIGDKPALIVYFVDKIYDPTNEERTFWKFGDIWHKDVNK